MNTASCGVTCRRNRPESAVEGARRLPARPFRSPAKAACIREPANSTLTQDRPDILTAWQGGKAGPMAHNHSHDHEDLPGQVPSDPALRIKALESILVELGLVDPATIDAWIEAYETRIGPHHGAKVVARAWVDPDYRRKLLEDASGAIAEMDLLGVQGQHIVVVENTPTVHNLVVCTLCSCYPWSLLGLPPRWYKAAPYRSRAVIDPRGVLREFGVDPSPA